MEYTQMLKIFVTRERGYELIETFCSLKFPNTTKITLLLLLFLFSYHKLYNFRYLAAIQK